MKPKYEIILLPDKSTPLVHFDIALKNGSLHDPDGKDGTASLAMSMLLRGTKSKNSQEFHAALDLLGAEIQIGKFKESMRIYGAVLAEKLDPFLTLLEEMLVEPRFSEEEFAKIKAIFKSALLDELGSDDEIIDRRFHEYCLWGNPYGKLTSGSLESFDSISLEDIRAFHRECFRADDFIFGAAGGFDRASLKKRLEKIIRRLPAGTGPKLRVKAPRIPRGKNVLLLDKPDRTQAHIMIGAAGVSFRDKDYLAMVLANHVFGGGSFSARLMKEVREKRGWSYGAYSWFKSAKFPLYFVMQAVPSNKDAVPAAELMLELYRKLGKAGITKAEFEFTKRSLLNQSAFLQDTLRKRLDNKVTEKVLDLPEGYYDSYRNRLQKLTYRQVQSAIRRKVVTRDLFVCMLGPAKELKKRMKWKGFKVKIRDYRRAPGPLASDS